MSLRESAAFYILFTESDASLAAVVGGRGRQRTFDPSRSTQYPGRRTDGDMMRYRPIVISSVQYMSAAELAVYYRPTAWAYIFI